MDYIVLGLLQARILEWVAVPFSRVSSQLRDQTQVSQIADEFFYQLSHQGSPLLFRLRLIWIIAYSLILSLICDLFIYLFLFQWIWKLDEKKFKHVKEIGSCIICLANELIINLKYVNL